MGYFTATWTPGRFPLSDVLSMPVFIGGKEVAVEIGNTMYEKILHQEFTEVKMLSLNGCIQAYLWTTEPVHTLEELKGLRIRSPGGLQTYMIEALGAEPVFMPLGDVYLSMETGVIDGIVTCPPLFHAFKLLGLAYTHQVKGHPRVTLIVSRLPLRLQAFLEAIVNLLSMFIVFIVIWQGWVVATGRMAAVVSDTLEIPQLPFRLLVSMGAALLFLELLVDLAVALVKLFSGSRWDKDDETATGVK